jgi:hypothetical protein
MLVTILSLLIFSSSGLTATALKYRRPTRMSSGLTATALSRTNPSFGQNV